MDNQRYRKEYERLLLMADEKLPDVKILSDGFNSLNSSGDIDFDPSSTVKLINNSVSNKYDKNGVENQEKKVCTSNMPFPLHQAASEGLIDEVIAHISCISKECSDIIQEIDCVNLQGLTPLHLAARFNRVNIMVFLLNNGAWIDKPAVEEKNTPLHLAAKYNMTAAANCLCERGADVNLKNKHGSTALHLAARRGNEEICRALIDRGCDINAPDNGYCTPLHMAILGGSVIVTKLLIKNGADVSAKDTEGEGPIHYAAAENQEELIIMLTKGVLAVVEEEKWEDEQRKYVNLRRDKKDTALHIAARAGYLNTVKTLVSIGANVNICSGTNSTPLHLAAINGDQNVVEYLLNNSARINVYDDQNMSPLHKACQFGRLNVIKLLIESGAQIDSKDSDCFTPLMWAVWKGQNDVVEYLLNKGAKVDISEMNMKNVLHLAIEKSHSDTLQLLIKNGGLLLINDPDKDFRRPLHYAAMNNDIESVKILVQELADIDVTDNEEKTPLHTAAEHGHFKCLLLLGQHSPRSINGTDERGRSPLHLAAKNGWKKTTKCLIEMGAETSGRDDANCTPLDYAARNGHSKIVLVLVNNGVQVDAFDQNKLTPLHHASIHGHVDCINILLNNGASLSFQNKEGKNCLDLAVENSQKEACMIFIMHKRWEEALSHTDNEGYCPMEKMISLAPEVAKVVLDRCIQYAKVDEKLETYYINYDFKFLDLPPEQQKNKNYFGPSNMVAFQREDLLSHPLTVQLINDKWARLGRWIYYISLYLYILFVSMLTSLLLIDKARTKSHEKNTFQTVIPWLTLILSVFEICKEITQAYILGKEYFKDLSNYLELILYSTTFVFMVPFILQAFDQSDPEIVKTLQNIKWNTGAVAIFFAWANLLLYLKRFTFFGLYVVMIVEVLKTLISVILVFIMIIMAFSLSFFVLFGNQIAFMYPGRSIVKTVVMTLGEFDYDTIFSYNSTTNQPINDNDLHYPEMSYILFTIFLIVCPIILMNLLVGLAVGDIDTVRKSAYILMLKAQVDILKTFESRFPKWMLKKVYRSQLTVYPNEISWKKRIFHWFGHSNYDSLKDEQERRYRRETAIAKELESQRIEFDRQRKRMKTIMDLMQEQLDLTNEIAVTLKVKDE